ncbi:hypothetical protein SLS55_005496 [Diplodia seriata]|uniref:Putative thiol methyltransferase 2 n=1 Tax=Diplodia seriata TaxID=420778 RepID=A0A1S8BEM3_9PEZI|nr:putative thiol methyltransferase 2 [Diplodia seriata]
MHSEPSGRASPPPGQFNKHPKHPSEARERLLTHFGSTDPKDQGGRWDDLWKEGDFLPWDKGFPNPALHELLTTHVFSNRQKDVKEAERPLVPAPVNTETKRRKRALVPGCGKGYDVVLLASYGYDAWGLEVSSHAIELAKKWTREVEENEFHKYETIDKDIGRGSVNFVLGDFFKDDWLKETGGTEFDLIYDYTFLSALPPQLRPAWSLRMSQLLSHDPHAALVCIEFPTYKEPNTGGPPFGCQPRTYEQHLSRPGEELKYGEDGHVVEEHGEDGVVPRNKHGLVRLVHFHPEQSHEIGKGTDFVSIWRHQTA